MSDDTIIQPVGTPVTDAAGGGQQPGASKVFTQVELEAILAERLGRQKAQYKDYEQLKADAANWQKLQEQQKTEQQKLVEAAEQAKKERDEALQRAQSRLIRAAFVAEAAKAGAAHPEDVYALADLSRVSLDDDDNVVGVTEAVKAIVEAGRVPLSQRATAPSLDAGAGTGKRPAEQKQAALTEQETEIARKLGISPEDYARGKTRT